MLKIKAIERLVHELSRLPGVGPKTAQRLAYHFIKSPPEHAGKLAQALLDAKTQIHECPQCFNLTDLDGPCHFCLDPKRDDTILCVVQEASDIMAIDGSGAFRGRYHVLHGTIAPLEGRGPKDLRIDQLLARLQSESNTVKELILALDADFEGDTTVLYLTQILRNTPVRITRIAHGVPIGGSIEYIDDRTIGRALENRVVL